jgi:hypothetical protein
MVGVEAQFHFLPGTTFDPWVGAGVGGEKLQIWESAMGWNFLLQAGGDIRLSPHFSLGPFVGLNVGEYLNYNFSATGYSTALSGGFTNQALHEWFLIGVRLVFDSSSTTGG